MKKQFTCTNYLIILGKKDFQERTPKYPNANVWAYPEATFWAEIFLPSPI